MLTSLDDRIILVTNTVHFVGLPSALEMARQGGTVVCHDQSFADDAVRSEFQARNPGLVAVAEQGPGEVVRAVVERFGRLDVLVSNDYFPAIRARIEDADPADLMEMLEALVVTPFAFAAAVVPTMKERRSGKILFITSAVALRGVPNYSMYVTARGATNALALSLAKELAPQNIQVNAIAPNYVENPSYFPPDLLADPESRAKITRNIPLGRLGASEEIATVIAFYASSATDFMTGAVVPFAGGWA